MSRHQVRAFRREYRNRKIPAYYHGWAHLLITSSLCVTAIIRALERIERLEPVALLAVLVAWLLANSVEYGVHRNFQHRRRPPLGILYDRHTLEHHRFFTHECMANEGQRDFRATMFPVWIALGFIVLVAGGMALAASVVIGRDLGLVFYAALVIYYLFYEWAHLCAHMPADSVLGRLPGVGYARRQHGLHHDPSRMHSNFNFALPIGDWLFGTRAS